MTLSNTATPRYYGEFREKVWNGEIPVSEEVAMEMNRIDELIANPAYFYDEGAIEGFVKFCERELTLTDGSPLHLLDSFKLWAESLLSWFYFVDREVPTPDPETGEMTYVWKRVKLRLVNKQYLIVARGAAKSMYASCLQAYFLNIDTTTTQQVTTAPTMKQAEEVMAPIKTAIMRAPGPLFKFLTQGSLSNTTGNRDLRQKLVPTKKGIENFFTNSILEIRPMTIDKLQGLRSKYNTIDEWLSGDVREDVVNPLEQGASKNDDWIIVAISSEGTVRNSVGDSVKIELGKLLRGEAYDPHISIWHYKLDKVEEVAKPELWIKANPNIGKTVSWETYAIDVEKAERAPAARNDILAKRFGLPMEGYTYYFTYEETIPTMEPPRPGHNPYWNMPASLGADLSQGDDFTAFTFLFPLGNERFGIDTRSYITSNTFDMLPPAMHDKYQEFIDEGTLIVFEGIVLDMMEVYFDLDSYIEKQRYDVRAFGYDPYNAKEFVEQYITDNGESGVDKVIQGARTESVPLGEIKKLSEQRNIEFWQSLMSFAMGNAITMEDTNGNRKLLKTRREDKIDNVSAFMNAYIAMKRNMDMYE